MKTYQMETIISLNLAFLNISNLTGISSCTNLQYLDCRGNCLTYLDLSNNSLLSSINCSGNTSLSTIDLRNGNNSNLTSFIANNTPNLNCVLVDDVSYFQNNWSTYNNLFTGVCGQIWGCEDSYACNYNSLATVDNGNCTGLTGCTDSNALNYDSNASCYYNDIYSSYALCSVNQHMFLIIISGFI